MALFGTPIGGPPNGGLFGTLSGELLKNYIYYIARGLLWQMLLYMEPP